MQLTILAGAMAMLALGQTGPGELSERLNSEPKAVFDTGKKPYDLEICLADALTIVGVPSVYRDGPENIVLAVSFAGGNAVLSTISVTRTEAGSHLTLRARGKGYDDRLMSRIRACL